MVIYEGRKVFSAATIGAVFGQEISVPLTGGGPTKKSRNRYGKYIESETSH